MTDWRKLPGLSQSKNQSQPNPNQQAMLDQFQQHQAEVQAKNAAMLVVDKFKDEQRRLFSMIIGWKVHDVVEFIDNHGDDQIATFFGNYKGRDFMDKDKSVAQLINLEQTRMSVVFVELVFNGGKFWDVKSGQNFILAAKTGCYAPVMLPKDVERVYASTAEDPSGNDQGRNT